ncbi:MAG: SRPBCC family protein [Betaproteobacteria bacterium]
MADPLMVRTKSLDPNTAESNGENAGSRPHPREWFWVVGRLFRPGAAIDAVTTRAGFDAPPDEVWQRMVFYEEVPHRPPLMLRVFLPTPVKTQGNGRNVGATVECTYSRGSLIKRITVLDRPGLVRFEVIEQRLGVERCVTTVEGSYELRADGDGTEVALTTRYRGHLRPRWLLRPFERLLAHQLHRHILGGMGANRRR